MDCVSFTPIDERVNLPKIATRHSACIDVYPYIEHTSPDNAPIQIQIPAGESYLVKTGLKVSMPNGFLIQVCSRSGLAIKHGIHVLNSPGIIDADYEGEICIILHNASKEAFFVNKDMPIAQLLILKEPRYLLEGVKLRDNKRGTGGFGSTDANPNPDEDGYIDWKHHHD